MAEQQELDISLGNLRTSFGKRALELVKEVKRSRWLPDYPEKTIEDISKEITACHEFVQTTVKHANSDFEGKPNILAPVTVRYSEVVRSRRCVLSVLQHRAASIRDIWWQHGTIIPEEKRNVLSKREEAYFREYATAISDYCEAIGDLDLSQDPSPPTDLFVEVRVLKSSKSTVVLASGAAIEWREGETHRMRREDADLWMRNGFVVEVVCDGDGSDH